MARSKNVKFKSNMKNVEKMFYREAENRLKKVGKMLKSYLNDKLEGPRNGRFYRMPLGPKILKGDIGHNNSLMYQASEPGEYPAKRLGDLRATLSWIVRREPGEVCLIIGSPMEYASDLEFEMDRPFLGRAINENLEEVKGMLGKGLSF